MREFTRILIVCEGSKTEPNYIRELCHHLRLRAAAVEVVGEECESAPISVYRYAAERLRSDTSFDEVYCVFDRDRHATFDAAVTACAAHHSRKFQSICSFPCFEYWLLIHFRFTRSPIAAEGNDSPGDVALRLVRAEWAEYRKGMKGTFAVLEARSLTEVALQNAARARRDVEATLEPNPSTQMDILVSRLMQLAQEQQF